MTKKTLSASARDTVHNFTHYAALVDAGVEVIITRRGRPSLKLVSAKKRPSPNERRDALVKKVLSIRALKPFKEKFQRSEAYE